MITVVLIQAKALLQLNGFSRKFVNRPVWRVEEC